VRADQGLERESVAGAQIKRWDQHLEREKDLGQKRLDADTETEKSSCRSDQHARTDEPATKKKMSGSRRRTPKQQCPDRPLHEKTTERTESCSQHRIETKEKNKSGSERQPAQDKTQKQIFQLELTQGFVSEPHRPRSLI
jgi:hypothetical protein